MFFELIKFQVTIEKHHEELSKFKVKDHCSYHWIRFLWEITGTFPSKY